MKLLIIVLLFVVQPLISQEYKLMMNDNKISVKEVISSANLYFKNHDKGKGSGYKQFKRWEYWALKMMNEKGFLPSQKEIINELEKYNAYKNREKKLSYGNWVEHGPNYWNSTSSWSPGVGRITSIALDQANTNHLLVGAESGGIWESEDLGLTWAPLSDFFLTLDVYSLAIDPSNSSHYYYGSNGALYKSEDSGATWELLTDIWNSLINKIVIHPTNSDIIFVSVKYEGVYRTLDGGANWNLVSNDSQAYDIEFKPDEPSVVYISGLDFNKSVDTGATFTKISGFNSGAKMIGVSPDNPDYVYVVEAVDGKFEGLYLSTDEGNSFEMLDHGDNNYFGYSYCANDSYGQAPKDMDIVVNPNNVNEIHIAGVNTWRSLDGGISFELSSYWVPLLASSLNVGYCHADVDIMIFTGDTLIVGSDGGIFKALGNSTINDNYYTDITTGLGIRHFYKLGISQTDTVAISAGSKDNGTSYLSKHNNWSDWLGADGMDSFISESSPDFMFGSSQFGKTYSTFDGGATYTQGSDPSADSVGNWVSPFEKDPMYEFVIYLGHNSIYRSTTFGLSWIKISQTFDSPVEVLKIAPTDNKTIYLANETDIYKTTDGGNTDWLKKTAPGGNINCIAVHPLDPNKLAVASTDNNKVFISTDGGDTWVSYKKNLPNLSALTLIWDNNGKNGLYLGMNYGIYYIDDSLSEWESFNNNLPNVRISELEINYVNNRIYVATYGRGIWSSSRMYAVLSSKNLLKTDDLTILPNPIKTSLSLKYKYVDPVSISIYNSEGKLLKFYNKICINDIYTINLNELSIGEYFIRLNSARGSLTKKFLKVE